MTNKPADFPAELLAEAEERLAKSEEVLLQAPADKDAEHAFPVAIALLDIPELQLIKTPRI